MVFYSDPSIDHHRQTSAYHLVFAGLPTLGFIGLNCPMFYMLRELVGVTRDLKNGKLHFTKWYIIVEHVECRCSFSCDRHKMAFLS